MAVRGVYTKAEEKMTTANNKKADQLVGWGEFPNRLATVESMKSFAIVPDQWNPLWTDENTHPSFLL